MFLLLPAAPPASDDDDDDDDDDGGDDDDDDDDVDGDVDAASIILVIFKFQNSRSYNYRRINVLLYSKFQQ